MQIARSRKVCTQITYAIIITLLNFGVNGLTVKKVALFNQKEVEKKWTFFVYFSQNLNSNDSSLSQRGSNVISNNRAENKLIVRRRLTIGEKAFIIFYTKRRERKQMQLEECVNYLLTTAQHSVFLKMTEKLSVYDITPIQYAVLYCLWENDKRSPKEIAERLKLENSTISGILERMEKKGLIERNISKEDRRFIRVQLTKKGADLEKDVLNAVEEVNGDVLSVFSQEERSTLKSYLRLLAGVQN